MSRALWLCLLALASCYRGSPLGHDTTCQEFGSGATFDPQQLIGNWTSVYTWTPDNTINRTETITISELTSSELEQHDIVKYYPESVKYYLESVLKLKMLTHSSVHRDGHNLDFKALQVLIPTDSFGYVDVWVANLSRTIDTVPRNDTILLPFRSSTKWQKVDGFLLFMSCSNKEVIVLADTSAPDEARLQKVVADVHFEGYPGRKMYPDSI